MYSIVTTKQFEKDILLAEGQKKNMTVFADILKLLEEGKTIPETHKNHKLKGIKPITWDLHIQPDWILLYIKDDKEKVIKLVRTGSHAHIFR